MRITVGLMLVAVLFAIPACGSPSDSGGDGVDTGKATQAAAVADDIARNPDDPQAALDAHGMTMDEFDALMFEVAADPALTKAYEEARKVPDPR